MSCREYISTEDEILMFKCLKCRKRHKKRFNKNLIKRFANTYEFCDGDILTFCDEILFDDKNRCLYLGIHG